MTYYDTHPPRYWMTRWEYACYLSRKILWRGMTVCCPPPYPPFKGCDD
jgi:hypothetical protein